eukprot:CAMPEP_0117586684 /NCGR_PEP_ID=MMETSP0784-20121206/68857_1 /TAXON_ID=39447 /ORGANISM="" /LENGTH=273 /DNA_ID=CAMNT_0005387809 /DNA_START=46 /DNA_END=867 /DNA_ORIENTATION=-
MRGGAGANAAAVLGRMVSRICGDAILEKPASRSSSLPNTPGRMEHGTSAIATDCPVSGNGDERSKTEESGEKVKPAKWSNSFRCCFAWRSAWNSTSKEDFGTLLWDSEDVAVALRKVGYTDGDIKATVQKAQDAERLPHVQKALPDLNKYVESVYARFKPTLDGVSVKEKVAITAGILIALNIIIFLGTWTATYLAGYYLSIGMTNLSIMWTAISWSGVCIGHPATIWWTRNFAPDGVEEALAGNVVMKSIHNVEKLGKGIRSVGRTMLNAMR